MIHQEDITLINMHAPNQGALKYIKQLLTELKRETGQNTIIARDLNTHCQVWTDHVNRKSIRK